MDREVSSPIQEDKGSHHRACASLTAMPWKPAALSDLEREKHQLQMAVLNLRQQLSTKQQYAGGLEYLLRERLTKIDELNGKLEQSRERIKQLDAENEHLVDMIRIMPQLDPAVLSPK
jgi:chromosome segregation ATPase